VNNGYGAYRSNQDSSSAYKAARHSGGTALSYDSSYSVFSASSGDDSHGNKLNLSLSPSCQSAASSGSVHDRINCALSSDPSLPAFVGSPKFLSDFQKATGHSLQETINQSSDSLLNEYSLKALKHAYDSSAGKVSFMDFVGKGIFLVKGIAGKLNSKEDQSKLVTSIVPHSLRGMLTDIPMVQEKAVVEVPSELSPRLSPQLVEERPTLQARLPERDLASTTDIQDDPNASIFEQVSKRYRIDRDLVEKLDWALPMNRRLAHE